MTNHHFRILLVDDNLVDRMGVKRMLDRSNITFEVEETDSMANGLSALRRNPFDCVLIDYRLPDGNGLTFHAQMMREGLPDLALILLTGIQDDAIGDLAISSGMQDYLVKDLVDEALLSRSIRYAIERKRAQRDLQRINSELESRVARRTAELKKANHQLRRINEELRAAQMRLIEAAKLESVGTLAAGVAHEVKNPLQTILMGVDYLRTELRSKDDVTRSVIDDIRNASYRADSIVKVLLEFSRANKLELRPSCLHEVIKTSLNLVKLNLIKSKVMVRLRLMQNPPTLMLDPSKMEQVFINLIMNSIQAIKSEGTITLTTSLQPLNLTLSDVGGSAITNPTEDETVCVTTLDDTGPGIPGNVLPRIFDPFFTTKPVGQGTGLGLAMMRNIVQMHSGNVYIRNRSRGGVRATIILPLPKKP